MPAGGLAILGCMSLGLPTGPDVRKRIRILGKIQRKYGFKENNADRGRLKRLFALQQKTKKLKQESHQKKRTNLRYRLNRKHVKPSRWARKHHRTPSY